MRDFQKEELEKEYDLELTRIVLDIKNKRAKIVCLQLPDGLKNKAENIAEYIESKTEAICLIWIGTCFGACDVPNVKADLLVQFGHSEWTYQ